MTSHRQMGATERPSERSTLILIGALLVGGFLLNAFVTMAFHPSGDEDNHPAIFTEYANSGGWVATHAAGAVSQIALLVFAVGVLATGIRRRDPLAAPG
jgi:hypothetical protein